MKDLRYTKIVDEIMQGIHENEEIIKKAIANEFTKYGHQIELEGIKKILENKNEIDEYNLEGQEIAVLYNGNIEITIKMILSAFRNDFKLYLYAESYKVITQTIITLILESLKNCGMKNEYICYEESMFESELIKNQEQYDKVIYIGDYFEYEKFNHFIKQDVYYDNFGYIKILIDKNKYKDEYKKISKESYIRNIYVDFYEDLEEFLEEVITDDFAIAYTNSEKIKRKINEKLPTKEVLWNTFDLEKYEFKVNSLMAKL